SILIAGVIACLILPSYGQINNTVYFMHGVPQSSRINPAFNPNCGFYLGFPLVAPARGGLSFSSHMYSDFIQQHPTEDSLITFLHPLADLRAFMDKLKPVNLVVSNVGTSLASMGLRTDVGFFSLDVATRFDGTIKYPADLLNLLVYGGREGETYILDGLGADLTLFTEVSVGWSGKIWENLDIGARAKVLFGIGSLYTRNSELSIYTSEESWNIKSDMLFNASLGFADVVYDEEGMIEDIIVDEELRNLSPYGVAKYAFNAGNLGFGLDLGAVYRPIDQLSLSVSVVDLAYIRWKEEVHQVSFKTEYEYIGVEVNPFDFSEDYTFGDHRDSTFSQMADSLSGFLEMGPGGAYSQRLNTKLYAGASYEVHPMINFGILARTDFLNGIVAEQVTASANFTTGRYVNLTLSYSYIHGGFRNIGAGFSFNLGPLNMYLLSDNALNVIFWPELSQAVNVWLGLNLVFGYKGKVDQPLVY
ncbi:MAG: hypothetical protein KAT15_27030, partial [Bacteroidales bacterium]|nr:hypothetical protein [Bacteroidales bacterium]